MSKAWTPAVKESELMPYAEQISVRKARKENFSLTHLLNVQRGHRYDMIDVRTSPNLFHVSQVSATEGHREKGFSHGKIV